MTKQKNTKRALLASVLSMMLSMAMLVGSTFAWFTDSVNSGKNRIVAGNLDVELYYNNASTSDWADASKETEPRFFVNKDGDAILWEPGVMAVTQFKVANEGSLALKYSLSTLKAAFNSMAGHDLSEVIKFAVIDNANYTDAATRESILALNPEFDDFTGFKAEGQLYPKDNKDGKPSEEIFTVVAYWEPNVTDDNLYNVNNGQKTDDEDVQLYIDIEIQLVATQTPYENDSFGNGYDENAASEQNMNALKLSAQGYKAVRSLDDLTYTLTEDNGEKVAFISNTGKFVFDGDLPKDIDWVFNSNDAPIVIDLNGHTANNCFYVEDGADLTITDSYGNGKTGFEMAVFDGSLTIDGGKHGNVGVLGGNLTINDGSCTLVIGEGGPAGTDNYADGEVVINGGTITSFTYIREWTNKITINGGKFPAYSGMRPIPFGNVGIIDIYGGLFEKVGMLNNLSDYVRGDSVITEITDDQNKVWYKVAPPQG